MFGPILERLIGIFQPRPRGTALDGCEAASPAPKQAADLDPAQLQHLIGTVAQLTSRVAQDVGHHNTNIQAISDELTTVAQSEPTAVAAIACKLLVANQELQSRLQRAEETLQDHSQQLQVAMTTARTDGLTGIMNRRALDEELRRCLADFQRHGRPATLLMLDVDRFKKFNDTYGHLVGDQALMHVASVLQGHSRATDIIARFGGEEFAVVFTSATAAAVRDRAERLRSAIGQRKVALNGHEVEVKASAGLAEVEAGESIAGWISRADTALYAAKNAGRDCSYLASGGNFEQIKTEPDEPRNASACEAPMQRSVTEAAAELAVEAFADTAFVQCIARRIAEWRRGGATMTVVLARLDGCLDSGCSDVPPSRRTLQVARGCLREMDMVTRWQSDGLAFLLPGTSTADAKAVARRLKNAASADTSADGEKKARLSFCIGIAEGIEGNDAKRVLERAWLALEAARSTGPGSICVHDGIKAVGIKLAPAMR